MSLEQTKEVIDLPLDEIAAELSTDLDESSDKEDDVDLFSQQKEDSDVGSEIGSDIEDDDDDDDDAIKLKDDEINFDEDEALIEIDEENEKSISSSEMQNVEDDDEDEDYEEHMKKLESNFDNSILLDYHPELKQANYNEILAMSKVIRNSKNQIIDPLHKTIPWLTKFEVARILGLRSKQINNGADTFIDAPPEIISGYTIAEMELHQKKIPFIIRRPLPNGGSEYWKVSDLDIIDN